MRCDRLLVLLLSGWLVDCGPERASPSATEGEPEGQEGEGEGVADTGPVGPPPCTPGDRAACTYDGGKLGQKLCHADRTWGPCSREGEPDPDAGTPSDLGVIEEQDLGVREEDLGVIEPDPHGCSDIYAQARLPTFELELEPRTWATILDQYLHWQEREAAGLPLKPYHPLISFKYGREIYYDVQLRLKGNPCCSWTGQKMQFVISFNEVNPRQRFHGVRKLSLDAPPYDPSFLHDRVALAYLRQLGLPAACANSARLVVNGRYYGLYTSIEHLDREYLQRLFPAADDGTLYKYGRELRTNEETADTGRMERWWAAATPDELAELTDMDELLTEWAGEAVIPHGDGYWAGGINFYLYDHPTRGFLMLPWDLDIAFDSMAPTTDPFHGRAGWGTKPVHLERVLADPVWRERWLEKIRLASAAYDPGLLQEWVAAWSAQIAQASSDDLTKDFSDEAHAAAVAQLSSYFDQRAEFLRAWLACTDGAPDAPDADDDGYPWCQDCNDGEAALHPGQPELCDELDNDCNGLVDDGGVCPDCVELVLAGSGAVFAACVYPRTWYQARDHCLLLGGELAAPRDQAEQRFLNGELADLAAGDEWWIGVQDQVREGTWLDSEGAPLDFTAWSAGRPNGEDTQNCGVLQLSLAGWNDRECEAVRPAVCRIE